MVAGFQVNKQKTEMIAKKYEISADSQRTEEFTNTDVLLITKRVAL